MTGTSELAKQYSASTKLDDIWVSGKNSPKIILFENTFSTLKHLKNHTNLVKYLVLWLLIHCHFYLLFFLNFKTYVKYILIHNQRFDLVIIWSIKSMSGQTS